MGRLNNTINTDTVAQVISGNTNIDVHIFIDEFGNVTQIEKKSKERLKYYIDPTSSPVYISDCVIGVSDSIEGDCSYGKGLGIGDNQFARVIYT